MLTVYLDKGKNMHEAKLKLDKRQEPHYNEKAVSGCSADGSAHGSGP